MNESLYTRALNRCLYASETASVYAERGENFPESDADEKARNLKNAMHFRAAEEAAAQLAYVVYISELSDEARAFNCLAKMRPGLYRRYKARRRLGEGY